MDALGRNHSLETAIADLIDNAIDAKAGQVLVRFVQRGPRLVCLYVVDDGRGIAPQDIDSSMTIGGRRSYSRTDLGHFGVGLKAASFSQAGSLTVMSRAAGHPPTARRWHPDMHSTHHSCDVIPEDFAVAELERGWPFSTRQSGTVIRWDDVRSFPATDDQELVDEYLGRTITHLRGHLGLTFHRLLKRPGLRITIDVEDTQEGLGLPARVHPLDPFDYPHTVEGWPKTLSSSADGVDLELHCHLWPRSNLPQFRLPGGAEHRQGLYFYRRDRLLQAGGWEGVHAADKRLQLARVSVDLDGDVVGLFTMNAEKSKVSAGPLFARAVNAAHAGDGTTIVDFLTAAENAWTTSTQRASARRDAILSPGRGLHPRAVRTLRDELPVQNADPLNIQWKPIEGENLFEVDRATTTLWLNQRYRRALLGGRRGELNDLPLLKTLLLLLTGNIFEGSHLGARDKDNIDLWQSVLTAAARAEFDTFEGRP